MICRTTHELEKRRRGWKAQVLLVFDCECESCKGKAVSHLSLVELTVTSWNHYCFHCQSASTLPVVHELLEGKDVRFTAQSLPVCTRF